MILGANRRLPTEGSNRRLPAEGANRRLPANLLATTDRNDEAWMGNSIVGTSLATEFA